MGWTASAPRNFASYALDIIAHSPPHRSLHYATPTRHMRQSCASRLIYTPQAPQARTFPRLTRHSRAILTASAIYCHHQFAPSCRPKELPSLEYQVRALSLRKAQCSRASCAYVALFTRPKHIALTSSQSSPYHSGSHHHHIPELLLCLHAPESLRAIRCSTALSHPYGALHLRFPAPFAFLARHSYTSLASSQSLQPRLHYACSSPYILIATSLVHHMMH
ncbi:hypothetical protein EDD22DRAFT_957298 [Suillus occidentalis]|nr:hypothetical protein EDD22DRAFT_957298 [Suillus occidentalis]